MVARKTRQRVEGLDDRLGRRGGTRRAECRGKHAAADDAFAQKYRGHESVRERAVPGEPDPTRRKHGRRRHKAIRRQHQAPEERQPAAIRLGAFGQQMRRHRLGRHEAERSPKKRQSERQRQKGAHAYGIPGHKRKLAKDERGGDAHRQHEQRPVATRLHPFTS